MPAAILLCVGAVLPQLRVCTNVHTLRLLSSSLTLPQMLLESVSHTARLRWEISPCQFTTPRSAPREPHFPEARTCGHPGHFCVVNYKRCCRNGPVHVQFCTVSKYKLVSWLSLV